MKPIFRAALVIANCLLVLAVVGGAISRTQAVVESGRSVFLKLAPVDPRSLMQGDYMTLRYAISGDDAFREGMAAAATRGRLLLKLDEEGVGTFSRLDDGSAEPAEDEVRLMYRKFRRGWRFGIESFFFQEGLGEVYEVAKYAELRVDPSGEAVLVDLRSEGLGVLDTRAGEAAGDGAAGNR